MLTARLRALGAPATLSTVLLLTGLLPSLLGWLPLLATQLRRLLAALLVLLVGPVLSTRGPIRGRLLVPGRGRPTSRHSLPTAGLLATLLLVVPPAPSPTLAALHRGPLRRLLSPPRLAWPGGGTSLSAPSLPSASRPVRWLPGALRVPLSTVLSALALVTAALVVHVVARDKVRRRANKRRPPFT